MAKKSLLATQNSPSQLQRSVLTAPLWMASTAASSRAIAEAVGTSQSFVSRTWQDTNSFAGISHEAALLECESADLHFLGFATNAAGSCIVFEKIRHTPGPPCATLTMESKRRLRTILAADLLRPEGLVHSVSSSVSTFWNSIASSGIEYSQLVVLVSGRFELPPGTRSDHSLLHPMAVATLVPFPAIRPGTSTGAGPTGAGVEAPLLESHEAEFVPMGRTASAARGSLQVSKNARMR